MKNTGEYRVEIVNSKLPDEVFGLKQFGLEERTPADYDRDIKLQNEADMNGPKTSVPTPAGGFPIASQPFLLSPWIVLTSVGGLLILVSLFLFHFARKKSST